ncbi:MAG: FAD-dependent oxidoreductase [Gemmataceae bacterium]
MPHPDVFIIGGGIVGLTTAYFLAKSGVRVTIADRSDLGKEASWAGAGIIPPAGQKPVDSPLETLRAESIRRFRTLADELKSLTGIDNEFHDCPGIEYLDSHDQEALALWERAGVPFQTASPVPPWLAAVPGSVPYTLPYCQVRNPRHMAALVAACRQVGVELLPYQRIEPGKFPPAGRYLIAAGAWADELLSPFAPYGLPKLVHPVRGQIVLFKPARPVMQGIVIVGHRYLVARKDGRVLAGSTEEPEAGFMKANTPEAVAELARFARGLVPELVHAEIETSWCGLRPGSKDDQPYIGPVTGTKNVFAAVGHYRAGVQLSPGTAAIMASLLRGERPFLDVDPFRLDREPIPRTRPTFRA